MKLLPADRIRLWLPVVVLLIGAPVRADPLDDCRQLWLQGNYARCVQSATPKARPGVPQFERFAELAARSQAAQGDYAAACKTLANTIRFSPLDLSNRLLLIELSQYAGEELLAAQQQREIEIIVGSAGGRVTADPRNLVALSRFALMQGADPKQVQDVLLKRARVLDPASMEPSLAIGQLALEKRDFALAADIFRELDKRFPQHPEILYGLARALEEADSQAAATLLERVLKMNPRHAGALLSQAETLIDRERNSAAWDVLEQRLRTNPRDPEALALQSAIRELEGQQAAADQLRQAALATWKTNPRVDFLIGRTLSRKYLFPAGALAQRRALEFDPQYLPARKQLALDLLRLGEEQEGWELADSVYQQDKYDVASYNLVTLRDELDGFTTLSRPGLSVRMDPHEAAIYGDRVLDLLQEAREVLCQKYQLDLDKTILVEIFPSPADFAVRTFGLPGAGGYLGVCFGDVVTARSPASQNSAPINWESVLWHEFAHVVTLNKTHNRMPRWLSEGISVYEERQRDRTWGEQLTPAYRKMIADGELTPISQLSGAFLSPKSSQHLLFAYYESSLVVEYLIKQYGDSALLAILDDLAVGMNMLEALERHTVPLAQLEEEFNLFVRQQVLLQTWSVDWGKADPSERTAAGDRREALLAWCRKHPWNYAGLKTCATLLKNLGAPADAARILTQAVQVYDRETGPSSAWASLAELEHELGHFEEEERAWQELADIDDRAATALKRLIEFQSRKRDWPLVQQTAERLIAIQPLIPLPYAALAEAAEHNGDTARAVTALQVLLRLEPIDPASLHYRLAVHYKQFGEVDKARREVLQALEQAPRYQAALQLLLALQPE